jgi:DNA repair protein RecO (recombination protein O)
MAATRRSELEPAYVLHRRAYRDTSVLLELLTRDHGRLGAIARGVRGRRSGRAGLLQPFQPLTVSWQARGELATLTGYEADGRPLVLVGRRLISGFYANELLIRLLQREDPHPTLYAAYAELMTALAGGDVPEGVALRRFERDLLAAIGYGLALTHDVSGQPLDPEAWYRYEPEHGPVPVPDTAGTGIHVRGASLLGLAAGLPDPAAERELRVLLRRVLKLYLGDRPLRSRELYGTYAAADRRSSEKKS